MVHHEVHTSVSAKQMIDNIFEVETALARVVCAPRESGMLLIDFAAAFPSVNHSWISTSLRRLSCLISFVGFANVLQRQYYTRGILQERPEDNSSWSGGAKMSHERPHVRHGTRPPFFLGSKTRSSQPPLTFSILFRALVLMNLHWAASSFRLLMTALSPAFMVVDQIAGLNLKHRKCYWVQYGSESGQSLSEWVATNCEEFREMWAP